MKVSKQVKIPIFILIGTAIGLLISNLFIFSDTIPNDAKPDTEDSIVTPYNVFQPHIPEILDFCSENVPLEYFDVKESLDFELVVNTYRHSSTILYIKRANRYFPAIEKILAENNVPDDMKYLCVAESGVSNVVSPAGASGFWQFMKATAIERELIVNRNVDQRYDPEKSAHAACAYLNSAYAYFGSWTLAAASYNMGMGGLQRDIDFQRVNSYWDLSLNAETARYIYRILAYKCILAEPEKYGFNLPQESLYQELDTYEIKVDSSINDLVQFAFDNGTNYKMLKQFNPWLRGTSLINNDRVEYTIKIPAKGVRDCEIPKE